MGQTASERIRDARSLRETRETDEAWSELRRVVERRQREWARRTTDDEEGRRIVSAVATTYHNVLCLMDNMACISWDS